jgi:hypothetical protein
MISQEKKIRIITTRSKIYSSPTTTMVAEKEEIACNAVTP